MQPIKGEKMKPYLIGLFLFLVSVSSFAEMQTYSEERMICRVTQDALTKRQCCLSPKAKTIVL